MENLPSGVEVEEWTVLNFLVDQAISNTTVNDICKQTRVPRSYIEAVLNQWERNNLVRTFATYSSTAGRKMMNLVSVEIEDLSYYRQSLLPKPPQSLGRGVSRTILGSVLWLNIANARVFHRERP